MSANNGNSYDELTDAELHKRLKAAGYDLPVSINRDFLIRKLQQADGRASGNGNNVSGGGTKGNKRMSLNVPTPAPMPNSRPARNSISANHLNQTNNSQPKPPVPTAPQTPARNHKQSTPPRQTVVKPVTPPPSPRKQKQAPPTTAPTPPRAQKVPFTNKYVTVDEDESEEEEEPTPPPKTFGLPTARKSNSRTAPAPVQARDHIPTPPVQLSSLPVERVQRYMKLFNNAPTESPVYRRAGRTSGRYSSDDDDSGDDTTYNNARPKSPVTRQFNWAKYRTNITSVLPTASNVIVSTVVVFFLIVFGSYFIVRTKDATSVETIQQDIYKIQKQTSFMPICGHEGVDPSACIPQEAVKDTESLFKEIQIELNQRRYKIDCYSPDDELASDNLSADKARSLLYRLSSLAKPRIESIFQYLLYFIIENPKGGLIVETELSNGTRMQLSKIDELNFLNTPLFVTTTSLDRAIHCSVYKFLCNTFVYFGIIAIISFIVYGAYLVYSTYHQRKLESDRKLFSMIDNILALLQEHHENTQQGSTNEPLAIQHIRDNLIQPAERSPEKLKLWDEAIEYILNNESRVREEMQHIRGEEYRVLKWLPTISPKRGNSMGVGGGGGWQGQAFEIVDGSPNSLPLKIPTNCLKVRHMYDSGSKLTAEAKAKIEAALHNKSGIQLKHVGYDDHNDCCVYIKCYTKDDAKKAYVNLHGWWYEGKLLSVKFLREERYNTRFPEAATI